MDDFDFEQRYRDVHECDPFHWYPLHLPPECNKMFTDLIRSNLGSSSPVRVVKERENPNFGYDPYMLYPSIPIDDSKDKKQVPEGTPYEKMLGMLAQDVQREPTQAEITFLPGVGVVALYKQPVSKQSGKFIKEVSKGYRDANNKFLKEVADKNEKKEKINKKNKSKKGKHGKKNKKIIKKGNFVAIVQTS